VIQFGDIGVIHHTKGPKNILRTIKVTYGTAGSEMINLMSTSELVAEVNFHYLNVPVPTERHSDSLFVAAVDDAGTNKIAIIQVVGSGLLQSYYGPIVEGTGATAWGVVKTMVLRRYRLAVLCMDPNPDKVIIYHLVCGGNCETCYGPLANNCITCETDYVLNGSDECINDCSGYDYESPPGSGNCFNCVPAHCDSCSSNAGCSSCEPDWVLYGTPVTAHDGNVCHADCPN
jgi:hypothetical protein